MKKITPAFIPALKKKKKNKLPVKKEKQKDIKFDDPNLPDMKDDTI